MQPEIVSHKGSADKPAVILIHGLGMDKDIWVNPMGSRILGGMFPLRTLLKKRYPLIEQGEGITTLFDDLRGRDYTVITWSQERPAGPIGSAVAELHEIIKLAVTMTGHRIILVGHSRGGLIARKYISENHDLIRGLVTISTPHKGSSIAKISGYLFPFVSLISPLIPTGDKGSLTSAVKRILDFLKSRALKELLPESNFFRSLNDRPLENIYYASVGGTNPTLINLHNIPIPDIFERVMPSDLYPEELKEGKGDGLVSAESSRLPWGQEHHNFDFNHAEILFDEGVRGILLRMVENISSSAG